MKKSTIKKLFFACTTAGLLFGLTACASESSSSTSSSSDSSPSSSNASSSSEESSSDSVTLKLGVVGTIYEELWAPAQTSLAEEGIILEFVQFSDYVTPNNALAHGEIDMNAFQHQIFLEDEIENHGYEIENFGDTIILPLNIYSTKVDSLEELEAGDLVAIPDDVTNGGRALKVLEGSGLISISEEAGFNPSISDIETYHVDIEIKELKANTIPTTLPDLDAAVINGNYALDFGLSEDDTIFYDSSLSEAKYWCLLAVRSADLEDEATAELYQAVMDAFQVQETIDVFNNDFGGYFLPAGWDGN